MRNHLLLLSIAVCGGVGAMLRYSISIWAYQAWPTWFPWGTFIVNMIGCCLLGAVSQASETAISPAAKAAIAAGLLGALTTFSTFCAETLDRLHHGHWPVALANVLANVVIGLLAVWLGATIVREVWG
jgi:CrcB protein